MANDERDVELLSRVARAVAGRLRDGSAVAARSRKARREPTDGWVVGLCEVRPNLHAQLWYDRYLDAHQDRLMSVWLASTDRALIHEIASVSRLQLRSPRTERHRHYGTDAVALVDGGEPWIGAWFIDEWPAVGWYYLGRYVVRGHAGHGEDAIVADAAADMYSLCCLCGPAPMVGERAAFRVSDEETLRLMAVRQGQGWLRDQLMVRFGGRCIVSGCDVPEVLEAAHIVPWATERLQEPERALLLRSDIHTLFDRGLMTIVRVSGQPRVDFDPRVALCYPYSCYSGRILTSVMLSDAHWSALDERQRIERSP